jgi:hypothetical protein
MKNMPPWLIDARAFETLGQNVIMAQSGNRYLLNRLDIFLADSVGHSRPDRIMKSVILHEVGHSFGLTGHSRYPGDVMFESCSGVNAQDLSPRDVKSIQMLYQQKAVITNEPSQSVSQYSKQFNQSFGISWAIPNYSHSNN